MMTLLIKWMVSALAVFLVGNFLEGIHVPDFRVALFAALVLGILNVTIRPVLKLVSFPITLLTLGLFSFVVNGFTFWLAARFISGFSVDSFWWAVLGAFLVSIISSVVDRLMLGSDGKLGDDA